MREVSIDSLQQQVRTLWLESWEIRIFFWGGGAPPMRVTLTGPPRGVSPSLPLSYSFSSFPSAVCSCTVASSPSLAGWRSHSRLAALGEIGLFCWLHAPSPLPPLSRLPLSPFPLPPLRPCPPRPLAPRMFRACCRFSGVWPLCGPPPGVRFMIWATMAKACSSGVFLTPNGGGAPTSSPVCPLISTPISSPSLHLALGEGILRSWGLPPISCIKPRTKSVRTCSGGAPPSPLGWMLLS